MSQKFETQANFNQYPFKAVSTLNFMKRKIILALFSKSIRQELCLYWDKTRSDPRIRLTPRLISNGVAKTGDTLDLQNNIVQC